MRRTKYDGVEKRKHIRTNYPITTRPIFQARGQELEIKDISRGGLKFSCKEKIKIKGWVKGSIVLINGTDIKVEGIVVRVEKKDMGLAFIGDLEEDVYHQVINTNLIAIQ